MSRKVACLHARVFRKENQQKRKTTEWKTKYMLIKERGHFS
jgi:hypothetical protein